MTLRGIGSIALVSCVLGSYGGATLAQQQISPGCAKIAAVLDQGGGGLSAEEVAKKTSTDIETARGCIDQWRSTMKDASAPKADTAGQPMPPGCAKIVAVLDQGGGLSADEVAKKTATDVETVRSCTDLWRQTIKGGQ
jgi:transposase